MISLLHCWLLCFAHSLSTCHFLFWQAQAKLSANDPKQSLWNLDRFPASLESGLVKLTSETPIGKSGGWSVRDKDRSPSAVLSLWEVQMLITLEVVKQMSVLTEADKIAQPNQTDHSLFKMFTHVWERHRIKFKLTLEQFSPHSHFVSPIS